MNNVSLGLDLSVSPWCFLTSQTSACFGQMTHDLPSSLGQVHFLVSRIVYSLPKSLILAWPCIAGVLNTKFTPYSKFPPCNKDVSFWISDKFSENNLCEITRNVAGDLVEEVKLIDKFTHPKTVRLFFYCDVNVFFWLLKLGTICRVKPATATGLFTDPMNAHLLMKR